MHEPQARQIMRDRAELSRFYSLGIGIVSIVWAHLSDGGIGSETCGDGGRGWNDGDGVWKAEDAPVKFDDVPSTLDQFSLQRKEFVLQGGVVASQPILPFSKQGVQAGPIAVRDGEREELVSRARRDGHIAERVGGSVVGIVVWVVEEGSHQGIPSSTNGVFCSVREER